MEKFYGDRPLVVCDPGELGSPNPLLEISQGTKLAKEHVTFCPEAPPQLGEGDGKWLGPNRVPTRHSL